MPSRTGPSLCVLGRRLNLSEPHSLIHKAGCNKSLPRHGGYACDVGTEYQPSYREGVFPCGQGRILQKEIISLPFQVLEILEACRMNDGALPGAEMSQESILWQKGHWIRCRRRIL